MWYSEARRRRAAEDGIAPLGVSASNFLTANSVSFGAFRPPLVTDAALLPHREFGRQRMAFAAPNMRFSDRAMDLVAERRDLNSSLQQSTQRTGYGAAQLQEFARVRLQNAGHRARLAQIACPPLTGGFQQAALLYAPSPEVVAVKILAFFSSRSPHLFPHHQLIAQPMNGSRSSVCLQRANKA